MIRYLLFFAPLIIDGRASNPKTIECVENPQWRIQGGVGVLETCRGTIVMNKRVTGSFMEVRE